MIALMRGAVIPVARACGCRAAIGHSVYIVGLAAYNNELAQCGDPLYGRRRVSITKSRLKQAQIAPGEVLRFEITYTNTGKVPLSGITVTDSLPTIPRWTPQACLLQRLVMMAAPRLAIARPESGPSNTSPCQSSTSTSGDTLTNQVAVSTAEARSSLCLRCPCSSNR